MDDLQKLKVDTMSRDLSACVVKKKWQQARNICEKLLKIVPDHEIAMYTLILVEVHLNNYDSALLLCQKFKECAKRDISFEEAYILYSQGKWAETMQHLSSHSLSKKDLELKAQVHFRLGEYDKSVELYAKLLEDPDNTNKSSEMYANALGACGLWLLRNGIQVKPLVDQFIAQHDHNNSSTSTNGYFETNFNLSFVYFGLGDYDRCIKLIESALLLASDDSRSEKLMKLQLAYIYQCKGDHRSAKKIIRTISDNGRTSLAHTILLNNRRSLGLKASSPQVDHSLDGHALPHQKLKLYIAKRSHDFIESNFSQITNDDKVPIVQLMYLAHIDRESASKLALSILESKENSDIYTSIYALNVLYEETESFYRFAAETLEKLILKNAAHFPGLIVLLGQMMRKAFGGEMACEKMMSLVDNLLNQPHLVESLKVYFLNVKAEFAIVAHKNYDVASKCLSDAIKNDPKNRHLFIKLISVIAHNDPRRAEEILRANPFISVLEDNAKKISVDDVERYEQDMKNRKIKKKSDAAKEILHLKRAKMALINKKKKKRHMLKIRMSLASYRPDATPNPERWLPKWERSDFKKSAHRRQKKLQQQRVHDVSERIGAMALESPAEPAKVHRVANKMKKRGGRR